MEKPKRTKKEIHLTLTLAEVQENYINKLLANGNMRAVQYIYALIQKDMDENKHNPLHATQLKEYAKKFKINRDFYY